MTTSRNVVIGACLLLLPVRPAAAQSPPRATVVLAGAPVEHSRDSVKWEKLVRSYVFPDDQQIRTDDHGKAGMLFARGAQVRLDANSLLLVAERDVTLRHGKAWFKNNNPDSHFRILTPGSRTVTNGTELVVDAQPDDVTVVSVLHGSVDLTNDAGTATIVEGFRGRAVPGVRPTITVLNPDDAVQWVLYYPTRFPRYDLLQSVPAGGVQAGFDELSRGNLEAALRSFQALTASSVEARVGSSMVYLEQGELDRADSILGAPVDGPPEVLRLTQLAAVRLRAGRAAAADTSLRRALEIDPTALRAMALRARIALTQNHKDSAEALADRLVNAHPQSVEAHLVAGEVAQAFFKLDEATRHFDQALALDASDVHALVNRGRIRFGSGDTRGAVADLQRATSLAPDAPEVRSLQGFVLMARGETRAARDAFERAIARDPNFAEPHLGLGLVAFKLGASEEGLNEVLSATLLEPYVALYHSYLGKAYHQLKRHREALAALEVAKRHDRNDPTPWLYAALIHRDLNEQGTALRDLESAIALNGYRAVYRSRLLLDRDMATKNVSLGEIYRELGFDAWAAHEGLNSLSADPTNASAHLLLADAFGNLPDRQQAQGSELLQNRLNSAVNQNFFSSFNEYTSLFEQPQVRSTTSVEGGLTGHRMVEQILNGGNDRVAFAGYFGIKQDSGARPLTPDKRLQGMLDLAFAPGINTNVIGSVSLSDKKRGFDEDQAITVGQSTGRSLQVRQVTLDRDTTNDFRDQLLDAMIGLRHSFSPATIVQTAIQGTVATSSQFVPDYTTDVDPDPNIVELYRGTVRTRAPYILYDAGVQLIHHNGHAQTWFVGIESYHDELRVRNAVDLRNANGTPLAGTFGDTNRNSGTAAWIRHEAELFDRLHTTVGFVLKWDDGQELVTDTAFSIRRIDPFVGMSIRLTPRWVIRTAAFQNLNSSFVGASVAPSSVAGFVIARNEEPYATRREGDLSIEHSGIQFFQMLKLSARRTEYASTGFGMSWSSAQRADYHFNYLLASRWALAMTDGFVRDQTDRYTAFDNVATASLAFVHERGFVARLSDSYVTKLFTDTEITELKNAQYNLTDAQLSYELPGKRAKATFAVTNIFDRQFSAWLEGLMMERPRPQRHAVLTFQVRY